MRKMLQPCATHIPIDPCKDIRLGRIHFYQREIITNLFLQLFPNTTRGLLEKDRKTPSTYLPLILLKIKLKSQGYSKIYPELNKRSYKSSLDQRLKIIKYYATYTTYLFLLMAFQPSLLEACYVKRSHLHLIKVL